MSSGTTACPDCGVANAADHNYCKHCGVPLKVTSVDHELAGSPAERMRDRYRALCDAYPDNAAAHFNLGSAYYHLGQVGNAVRAFQRARQRDDDMPAAPFPRALWQ
jgi:tetratricopeptide (TPR) repeat protein